MSEAPSVVDHTKQTAYSDPAGHAALFDDIDPTIEAVSAMSRNVVAHYRAQAQLLPPDSRDDIELRWVASILETDQRRHGLPLTVERRVEQRVQGCCRDHTLLAVAALRHHGIPARSRVGFASYLSETTWQHDHVIVEAWLGGRWRRFDPEFGVSLPRLADPTDIDAGDASPFLTASRVWLAHRAGALDVSRFGVAEGLGIDGDWFVYGYVIVEAAHRFGDELLLWDQWGAMHGDLGRAPARDLDLIDDVARLLVRADDGDLLAEAELLSRYRDDEGLHPGAIVRSYSPNGGSFAVDLERRVSTALAV